MNSSIRIIRKSGCKVSAWSGGTTTQLYIYPEDAVYDDRNFRWRLSSAKVAADESTFTPLPGISRILMIIEGEATLEHKGHHSAVLKAFEKDSFSGDWTTKCVGKVTDYNLMTDKSCNGSMDAFSIDSGEAKDIPLNITKNSSEHFSLVTDAFYIIGGDARALIGDGEGEEVHEGDLVIITRQTGENADRMILKNISNMKVNIIRTTVYY